MAQYLGRVQGSRGPVQRLGSKMSGLDTIAASWQGSVRVRLSHNADTDTDEAYVTLEPWHGAGVNRVLYDGPVSGARKRKKGK